MNGIDQDIKETEERLEDIMKKVSDLLDEDDKFRMNRLRTLFEMGHELSIRLNELKFISSYRDYE